MKKLMSLIILPIIIIAYKIVKQKKVLIKSSEEHFLRDEFLMGKHK